MPFGDERISRTAGCCRPSTRDGAETNITDRTVGERNCFTDRVKFCTSDVTAELFFPQVMAGVCFYKTKQGELTQIVLRVRTVNIVRSEVTSIVEYILYIIK